MDGLVIERLIVEWQANYEKFKQDTAAVKMMLGDTGNAARRTSQDFKATGTASSDMFKNLIGIGSVAGIVAMGLASIKAAVNTLKKAFIELKDAVKLAMQVFESENLFEVSLGKNADATRAWSESIANALGANADEIRKTVGLWNTMGESLGLSSKNALEMSKSLAQLKYDLMSYYNIGGEQADTIIKGMYSGETEPSKQIGVLLTDEVAMRSLVTHGIIKEGEAVDSTTKVYGRYLAITDQTKKAQGDMARTIDSPANQLRVLEAQIRSAKLELGQAFLPIVQIATPILTDFARQLRAVTGIFGDFSEAVFGKRNVAGLSDYFNDTKNATDEGAASLGKYDQELKKIKATVFGWDELNLLQDPNSGTGGTSDTSGAGGHGFNINPLGDMEDGTNKIQRYKDVYMSLIDSIKSNWGIIKTIGLLTPALAPITAVLDIFKEMKELTKPMIADYSFLPDDISEDTKANLMPFMEAFNDAQATVREWAYGNTKVTEEMAKSIEISTAGMGEKVKLSIENQTNTSLDIMRDHLKKNSKLSEEEQDAILEKIKAGGEKRQKAVDEISNRINEIMSVAAENGGAITESQQAELERLYEQMKLSAIDAMSESASEQEKILRHLEVRSSEISARQAADIVKNSYDAKELTIADAIDKADTIIRQAKRMYEAGDISEEVYNDMVLSAETARDASISAAEDTHNRVVEEARIQAGEHAGYVDWETGEILSKWDLFKKGMSKKWDGLGTWWDESIKPWFTTAKWKGLFDDALKELKSGWNNMKTWASNNIKLPEISFPKIKLPKFTIEFEKLDGIFGKAADVLGFPGMPKLNVEWFAGGGYPEAGQLFMARESGPEMVGTMGGRTAVANNNQIVSGIEAGVYKAVKSAMSGNGSGVLHLVINVGNGTIYDAVIDEASRRNIRAGKNIIPVGV